MSRDPEPTLLVTGGSSRIGRSVVTGLGAGFRFDFLLNTRPAPVSGPGVRTLRGGLSAAAEHAERIRSADAVLHMAGLSHADTDREYAAVNTAGTRELLAVCRVDQPVIYLSTRCAGVQAGAYGRSKLAAEESIRDSGQPYVIVRAPEVYGSKSNQGIDALIGLAVRWRVLADFRWRPEVSYSPVSSDELGQFIADVVRGDLSGKRTYTICNNRPYTAVDIQGAIQAALGKRIFRLPIPVTLLKALHALRLPLPFKPDQIDRLIMEKPDDTRPARNDYGFSPECFLTYLQTMSISS